MTLRSVIKTLAESTLAYAGPAAMSRRAFRRRTLILAYHNILPDGAAAGGDRSLHLPRAAFAEQLDCLVRYCEVIPLAELDDTRSASDSGRPRVAITFDDAYRGALTAGVAELDRRSMPATVFVAPGFIGGKSFWWDALASGEAGLPDTIRNTALEQCRGEDEAVRRWARDQALPLTPVPPHACAASEGELIAAARKPGISFGSHTWSHPNLPRLAADELRQELVRPLTWLRERFHNVIDWLSYPYGLASAETGAAARSAGYRNGLLVSGGWLPESVSDPFALPRLNIPSSLSIEGFVIRTAGLLCR